MITVHESVLDDLLFEFSVDERISHSLCLTFVRREVGFSPHMSSVRHEGDDGNDLDSVSSASVDV